MTILAKKPSLYAAALGLAAVAAVSATAAAAAISSNVYIDARKTFVLGGKQPGAFSVKGQNKGSVRVEVLAQADGAAILVASVEPGQKFDYDFAKGEGALLRNTSTQARAHVKVRVTGATKNLGMGYEGW